MIMKIKMADTRLLTLMLVVGAIGGTFVIVQGLDIVYDDKLSPSRAGAMLTGNVQVTQFGPDGNIIAYRQTDNHIVKQGMEIIMSQVFGGINGTYPSGISTHPVRFMAIGTGADAVDGRLLYNDTDLNTPVSDTWGSCARFVSVIDNSTDGPAHGYSIADGSDFPYGSGCGSENNGDDCSAQMNVTATASFYGGAPDLCSIPGIDEAGIFDSQALGTGYMFARNTFGSVDLGPLDTLRLDWEFTFTDA